MQQNTAKKIPASIQNQRPTATTVVSASAACWIFYSIVGDLKNSKNHFMFSNDAFTSRLNEEKEE